MDAPGICCTDKLAYSAALSEWYPSVPCKLSLELQSTVPSPSWSPPWHIHKHQKGPPHPAGHCWLDLSGSVLQRCPIWGLCGGVGPSETLLSSVSSFPSYPSNTVGRSTQTITPPTSLMFSLPDLPFPIPARSDAPGPDSFPSVTSKPIFFCILSPTG